MTDRADELVDSLLFEGYALYPYTPGATKNATPTPFGIVYPPGYAESQPAAFSLLRLECVLRAGTDATLSGTVRFLQPAGERHRAAERSVELGPHSLAELIEEAAGREFRFEPAGAAGPGPLEGRVRMRAEPLGEGMTRLKFCVHNLSQPEAPEKMGRGEALGWSLISVHPVLRVEGGRFISPLERGGAAGRAVTGSESVNTWPVLASDDDSAMVGAAIVLPDHPRIAPESLGSLFDNTEIEEALLLHVKALSKDERREIAAQDPQVREVIERADTATPEQLIELHGRLEMMEPEPLSGVPVSGPPNNPGRPEATVDGVTYRRGDTVVLSPGERGDPHDVVLRGKRATIERIYQDYEDGLYFAVTIDNDPGQELMRETGRYYFFGPGEVKPLSGAGIHD
jgi:hypothetical protein